MIIGVPKEIKDNEARVGITPAGARELTAAGHHVLVETQAGAQSGFPDAEYQNAGAEMVGEAGHVWGKSEMVVKVKEPIEKEYVFFRDGLVLFTYLHLAPLPALTDKLLESKIIGIAYETVRDRMGTLPLLTPMSEVAGRMSVQVGASYLEKEKGGRGILLGGVPGVPPAHVTILGGGIVGTNAARIALGFGAKTAVGYGAMKEDLDALEQRKHAQEALRTEIERQARIAAQAEMSPEDRDWDRAQDPLSAFEVAFTEAKRAGVFNPGGPFNARRLEFMTLALGWSEPRSRSRAAELLAASATKDWGRPSNKDRWRELQQAIEALKGAR